ncbi:MAG: hypothetical protein ACMG55_17395 [Microcoleus sp.]
MTINSLTALAIAITAGIHQYKKSHDREQPNYNKLYLLTFESDALQ